MISGRFSSLQCEDFSFPLSLQLPHLVEVTNVIKTQLETCSDQLLMEGLFAHFFSPYKCVYYTEDVQWFLMLANKQKHWETNLMEHAQQQPFEHHQVVTRTEIGYLSIRYALNGVYEVCEPPFLPPFCRFLRELSACVCSNTTWGVS